MTAWLKCDISKGMFPDEFTVQIKGRTPILSFFAPSELVRPTKDAIRCEIVQTENGTTTVVLPIRPYEQASRVIQVPTTEVESA